MYNSHVFKMGSTPLMVSMLLCGWRSWWWGAGRFIASLRMAVLSNFWKVIQAILLVKVLALQHIAVLSYPQHQKSCS